MVSFDRRKAMQARACSIDDLVVNSFVVHTQLFKQQIITGSWQLSHINKNQAKSTSFRLFMTPS